MSAASEAMDGLSDDEQVNGPIAPVARSSLIVGGHPCPRFRAGFSPELASTIKCRRREEPLLKRSREGRLECCGKPRPGHEVERARRI